MPRADLFVVCKNPECGAEVSPYITECPYCGARLRKRAPKLDRGRPRARRRAPRLSPPSLGRLRAGEIPGIRADTRPYATAALIIATCGMWIATRGGFVDPLNVIVNGPLGGHWWRVLTTQFSYFDATGGAAITGAGVYQFVTLTVVGVFGWLLETRHGPLVVVALFLLGGAGGALAAHAIDSQAVISGANGGALALLCAWAVPDLLAQRQRHEYEGDLLGAGALGLVMLAMPIARPEANAIAGGVGVLAGYTLGLGLARAAAR